MKIIVSGALGHMGREVGRAAAENGIEVAFGIDLAEGDAAFPLYTTFAEAPAADGAVIIDFSAPDSLTDLLAYAVKEHAPAVLATTGYTEEQLCAVDAAAKEIPVFRSANMSFGVAVLKKLSAVASAALESFDIEITETHHRRKADAPSGTALLLADAVMAACKEEKHTVCGRSGRHVRQKSEIGIHALRGGTVAGEHSVCFFGLSERIVLSHTAENRGVFASGAVRAAAFLAGQGPGLYGMDDMTADLF